MKPHILLILILTIVSIKADLLDSNFSSLIQQEDTGYENETELAQTSTKPKMSNLTVSKNKLKFTDDLKKVTQIFTSGPICLNKGNRVITAKTVMKGEVGAFSFDESQNVDKSGHKNILLGKIKRTMGIDGMNVAAVQNGRDPLVIKNLPLYNTDEFTFSFWVYIQTFQSNSALCPIIWKGQEDVEKKKFDRAPGIFIDQKTGKIKVYVTVTNADGTPVNKPTPGLTVETLGNVQNDKWTFVAVTVDKKNIRIHQNGILDGIQNFDAYKIKENKSDIYIGGIPPVQEGEVGETSQQDLKNLVAEMKIQGSCKSLYNIDQQKIYNRALHLYEIQGFVRGSQGMIEPSYIHLGCQDCSLAEASDKCIDGFHMCNSLEYYSGVFQAIKIMGWTKLDYHVFASDSKVSDPSVKGLAVCCRDQF